MLLSLVVPFHNEADVIDAFFTAADDALAGLQLQVQFVCVDDGSVDATYQALSERARNDHRIRLIRLSRNFGKEAALTAGLDAATGDLVVPMDADLQDPPALIPEFVRLWEQGYDVVYGVRTDRQSDSGLKRVTASIFYRLFNLISEQSVPPSAGDFRLMDRRVVDALKQLPERNRFMKGLFSWIGFSQVGVPYMRPARRAGETSWSYWRLCRLALDGLTSFTTAPLRIWTAVGLITAAAAVIYAGVIVAHVLAAGRDVPGYASLMVVLLFGFALQMVALGILGEYIGRMYEEVKGRPIYMVRERQGFDD